MMEWAVFFIIATSIVFYFLIRLKSIDKQQKDTQKFLEKTWSDLQSNLSVVEKNFETISKDMTSVKNKCGENSKSILELNSYTNNAYKELSKLKKKIK